MALVSLQGYWLRVNPRICEMLQYSERELMDRTFQDITYPLDLNTDLEYLQQLLKTKSAPIRWKSVISAPTARSSGCS